MMDFYWKSSVQSRVITAPASCPTAALLPQPWVSSDKAAPWDYPSVHQGDKLGKSSPKKRTADSSLLVSRAGWSIFSDQICVSHLCLPDPSLVPADKSPSCPPREARSAITNQPSSTGHTDVNTQLYFFTSSIFLPPFLLLLQGSFKQVPFPSGPEVPVLNLQAFPPCTFAFPSHLTLGCFLMGWSEK